MTTIRKNNSNCDSNYDRNSDSNSNCDRNSDRRVTVTVMGAVTVTGTVIGTAVVTVIGTVTVTAFLSIVIYHHQNKNNFKIIIMAISHNNIYNNSLHLPHSVSSALSSWV